MSLIAVSKVKSHMKARMPTAWSCILCLPGIAGMHRERERVRCFCLKRFVCRECCGRLSLETIGRPGKRGGQTTTKCICNDTTLRLVPSDELRLQRAIAGGSVERTLRISTADARFGVAVFDSLPSIPEQVLQSLSNEILTDTSYTSTSLRRIFSLVDLEKFFKVFEQYVLSKQDIRQMRRYKTFSSKVYGELRPVGIEFLVRLFGGGGNMRGKRILDFGFGIGTAAIGMALLIGADVSGVEIRKDLYELSRRIMRAFHYMTNQFGDIGTVDLLPPGDGCAESFRAQFHNLHYFFSNNFLFGPEINLQLEQILADTLPVGARVVVTSPFFGGVERAPTNVARLDAIDRRRRERLVFDRYELAPENSFSWTSAASNACKFYVYKFV